MKRFSSFSDLLADAKKPVPVTPRPVVPSPPAGPPKEPAAFDARDLQPGWICLAFHHFSDASGAKLRPVLVLSTTEGGHGGDVIVTAISTACDRFPERNVQLKETSCDFHLTGLKFSSTIQCTQPATLACCRVISKIGELPARKLYEVREKLARRLGLATAPVDNAACECHADAVLPKGKAG